MNEQKSVIGDKLEEIRDLLDIEERPHNPEDTSTVDFAWYVGSTGEDEDGIWRDFSDDFITSGTWENGWEDKFIDVVKSIKVGDRIALKAKFNQKNNLPFNNHGKRVGCMRIKAIGTVTENPEDGKHISVDWVRLDPAKTWYGPGTLWETIHGVKAADGYVKKQLLEFTFGEVKQDYSICEERYTDDTDNDLGVEEVSIDDVDSDKDVPNEGERISGGVNILLYGVPGSGKSWTIEHEYCTSDTIMERLVFHPDYTNADFVGQILPIVDSEDKQVTYEFAPGPFTNILRASYTHPQQKYVLVIEEINRGNAPAIFGDVFQLLDRCAEEKTVGGITYPVGTSEYGITNENVAKLVYGDATHKVRIPANLSILGTMNTSDQNVFTLDTAFQRRWRMRLIENNFFNVRKSLAQAEILDTGVTWRRFCETINTIIIGNKAKMASAEDKRLGVYFVHESDLKFDDRAKPKPPHTVFASEYNDLLKAEIMNGTPEDAARLAEVREALMQIRIFPEKVIKYLWDDAFKFNQKALFDTDTMDDLEKVIRTFVLNTGKDRFKIFRQAVRDSLYPQN